MLPAPRFPLPAACCVLHAADSPISSADASGRADPVFSAILTSGVPMAATLRRALEQAGGQYFAPGEEAVFLHDLVQPHIPPNPTPTPTPNSNPNSNPKTSPETKAKTITVRNGRVVSTGGLDPVAQYAAAHRSLPRQMRSRAGPRDRGTAGPPETPPTHPTLGMHPSPHRNADPSSPSSLSSLSSLSSPSGLSGASNHRGWRGTPQRPARRPARRRARRHAPRPTPGASEGKTSPPAVSREP
jgi:hypothetical protein